MHNNIDIFIEDGIRLSPVEITHQGLASILCYDPFLPRCIEGIKLNLLAGLPSLVRLHAGANYPTPSEYRYQVDLEGHAVLIVGFDDVKRAFFVVDPYRRCSDESIEKTWLPYEDLTIAMVDCSSGNQTVPPNLKIEAAVSNCGSTLQIHAGIPLPFGPVMDLDNLHLSGATLEVQFHEANRSITRLLTNPATARIGEHFSFQTEIPRDIAPDATVDVQVSATIGGTRPYAYNARVGTRHRYLGGIATQGSESNHRPDCQLA